MKKTTKMKQFISSILILVMVFAMTATAFAAPNNNTITINNTASGHIYEAYQIFTGDLYVEEQTTSDESTIEIKTLSNIVWGSGVDTIKVVDGKTVLAALKEVTEFTDCTDAASVAKVLADNSKDSNGAVVKDGALAQQFADVIGKYLSTTYASSTVGTDSYTITGLADGYYLVKDNASLTEYDAYTRYILEVVKNVIVTPKSGVPTVVKEVEEKNDTTGDASWGDVADYDFKDEINFKITGTLPSNYADYETYKYVFTDTLSAGLTYNNNAKVTIGEGTGATDITSNFTVVVTYDNVNNQNILTLTCNNLKEVKGIDKDSKIVVTYTATLNENAVIGGTGNTNTVNLTFSNDPNHDGAGTENPTGTTPDDVNVVFTYKTIINKKDENQNALTGAAFKLEKLIKDANGTTDTWTLVKEITVDSTNPASTFEFAGLDAGKYKLTETVTPPRYNTITPVEFEITATNDGTEVTKLTGIATELQFTANEKDGSLSADVINKAGSLLPSTGGIGTTIFYVTGIVLMLGAVVLFVVRRRTDR